jgi:hypothetical protein
MTLAVAAGLRSYRLDVSRRFLITFGANHTDPPGLTARLQKHELPNLGRSPLSAHITPTNSHDYQVTVHGGCFTACQCMTVVLKALGGDKVLFFWDLPPICCPACRGLLLDQHPHLWTRSTREPTSWKGMRERHTQRGHMLQ